MQHKEYFMGQSHKNKQNDICMRKNNKISQFSITILSHVFSMNSLKMCKNISI